MSSPTRPPDRDERREAARRARLDREGGAAAAGVRRRRLVRLGAVLVVTAVAVVVAIALSGGGGEDAGAPAGSATDRSASERAVRVLAGIPQDGPVLGRASAAVRVVEFADLQCPFCRDVALDGLPQLIQRHVRPGRVRLEFQSLAFIGPDSEKAARFAEAAGLQDRLWHAVELLYAEQGPESSGWVTDALLRRVARAVPGLDARRAFADMDSAAVTARLRAADALARRHRVQSTPTFLVGRGGDLRAVGAAGLEGAVEAAAKQR